MQSVRGRDITNGQTIQVYFNLHKNCFSIRDYKSNLVVAHAESVIIKNAYFRVRENGRQRVIRERQKNIHAFVEGIYVNERTIKTKVKSMKLNPGYYNPYITEKFIDLKTGQYLEYADFVYCIGKKIFYTNL